MTHRRTGQIVRRGEGTWLLRVYVGRSPDGHRIYRSRTVHGTRSEAEAELRRFLTDQERGRLPRADAPRTVGELLDEWMGVVRMKDRPSTVAGYERNLRLYVRPVFGSRRLDRLQGRDLTRHYQMLSERGLSPTTIRYVHRIVHAALDFAVGQGWLGHNPSDSAVLPRQRGTAAQALSREQAGRLLEAASERWEGLPVVVMLAAGLRPSEALGLRWEDVSQDGSELYLRHGRRDDELKTRGSRRRIPLPERVAEMLQAWREHQGMQRLMLGPKWQAGDAVFTTAGGKVLSLSGLKKRFKLLLRKAGLPEGVRLYDLRHSHATALLLAGVPLKVVSERLGHSSVRLTADTYSHVLPTMQDEAAKRIGDLLFR